MDVATEEVQKLVDVQKQKGFKYYCVPKLDPPKQTMHKVEPEVRGFTGPKTRPRLNAGFYRTVPSYSDYYIMPLDFVVTCAKHAISYAYVRSGGKVYRQIRGIPQGASTSHTLRHG